MRSGQAGKHGSLRLKLSIFILVGALLLSSVFIFIVIHFLNRVLSQALIEQGRIMGMNISELAAEKLVEDDLVGLRRIIEKYRRSSNIEYVIVEDFDHSIKTDTFNGQIPPKLVGLSTNPGTAGKGYTVTALTLTAKDQSRKVYDILVPIKDGLMGFIRIGMKASVIQRHIAQTLWTLVLFVTLGTGGIVFFFYLFITQQVTRPVLQLVAAARDISLGSFNVPLDIKVNNELRELADAIGRMRESLKTSLEKLKKRPITRF